MKKLTMILLVACVLLAGCEMLPELTTVAIVSDGYFDTIIYSDGARIHSAYHINGHYNVVMNDVSIRIMPIDDSNCVLYLDGVETAFTANVINEF